MIHLEVSRFLPQIKEILRNNHVKRAYLFGSVVTGGFNENSDIDILIDIDKSVDLSTYGEAYWNILFELENLMHRNIDLTTEVSIKNPYMKEELNQTKVLIL
jgi:hypothetical protein